MDSSTRGSAVRDELHLRELIETLWQWKWRVLVLAATAAIVAGAVAWYLPPKYSASIIISPVSDTSGGGALVGGISSVLSQIGNVASLAGIAAPADTEKAESVAVLNSEALTDEYIEENNLLPILYPDKWDAVHGQWSVRRAPTLWEAYQYFNLKIRTITTDPKTGMVTLTIVWRDPKAAAVWANGLVSAANAYLRKQAIDESERDIAYLNSQAAKTDALPIKQVIYTILQTEISKQMLARGNDQYAFKVLDPAVPPERPGSPRPLVWVLAALIGTLLLAVLSAYARLAWERIR
jgi:uncharacterized protein involved in exopolysaccharide biosynthesis